MTGYKDTEVEEAVRRFVHPGVRYDRDALGPTDESKSYSDVVGLVASAIVSRPRTVFYIAYLVSNSLAKDVSHLLDVSEELLDCVNSIGRRTHEITKVDSLHDASAALIEVDSVLGSSNAVNGSALLRYSDSLDTFIAKSLAPNIRDPGGIVRTAPEAVVDAADFLSELTESWGGMLSRVDRIEHIVSDIQSLNLQSSALSSVVNSVRAVLDSVADAFDSTAGREAVALSRSAYLDIESGRSTIVNYSEFGDPTSPLATDIVSPAQPVSLEAVNASLVCGRSAPWRFTSSDNVLKLSEDGESEKTYTLPVADLPTIISGRAEMYTIVSGTNDLLQIDGLSVIPITAGTRTAQNICDDINAWATAGSHPYHAYVSNYGSLFVSIEKTVGGKIEITALSTSANNLKIYAFLDELVMREGQYDSTVDTSAYDVAKILVDSGYVGASVEVSSFGGEGATITSSTSMTTQKEGDVPSSFGAGDVLIIYDGVNRGSHHIQSVTRVPGSPDVLSVETADWFADVSVTDVRWGLRRESLTIISTATDVTKSELQVGAGSANTKLDLSGPSYGQTPAVSGSVNYDRSGVIAGDVAYLSSKTFVSSVESGGAVLELTDYVSVDASPVQMTVRSAGSVAYEDLSSEIGGWRSGDLEPSGLDEDLSEVVRLMNPLLYNDNPSLVAVNDARTAINTVKDVLDSLLSVLVGFSVKKSHSVDNILSLLLERGMDRAYETLMDGDVLGFFGMGEYDMSYGASLLKGMRTLAQVDVPVTRHGEDAGDVVHDSDVSIPDIDADFDFSDADPDEGYNELGETPYSDVDYGDGAVRYDE